MVEGISSANVPPPPRGPEHPTKAQIEKWIKQIDQWANKYDDPNVAELAKAIKQQLKGVMHFPEEGTTQKLVDVIKSDFIPKSGITEDQRDSLYREFMDGKLGSPPE